MTTVKSTLLILCCTIACFCPTQIAAQVEPTRQTSSQSSTVEPKDYAAQLKRAFEAAKRNEYSLLNELKKADQSIVPFLAAYLDDANSEVRRQVVWLLRSIVGRDSVRLLAKALMDSDKFIARMAAETLYEFYDSSLFADSREVAAGLRRIASTGTDTTAALLLLAHFPEPATAQTLKLLCAAWKKDLNTGMNSLPMVSPSLPACVVLSKSGDREANLTLIKRIKSGDSNELEFMLNTINLIDNAEVLKNLFTKTIADNREIEQVIDGDYSGMGLLSRMKDLAVNRFAGKLNVAVSFELIEDERYKPARINEARRKIADALAAQTASPTH